MSGEKMYLPHAVKVPTVPNFLVFEDESGTVPIHEVSDDDLRMIGKLWTQALLARAARRRAGGGRRGE